MGLEEASKATEMPLKPDFDKIIPAEDLSSIIKMILNEQISRTNAKVVFEEVVKTGKSALTIVKELELWGDVDREELYFVVESIIAEGKDNIKKDYLRDRSSTLNYIIGGAKVLTSGKARAEMITEIADEIFNS